jgi:hypothetical protein
MSIYNKLKHVGICLAVILVMPGESQAKESERYYQDLWCNARSGEVEHRLPDRTRVDCLTEVHAIEFDFTSKWAEAIGQALHYSLMTGKRGGIVLIGDQQRMILRARRIIKEYGLPIDLWTMSE